VACASASGMSSKKKDTGTSSAWLNANRRLALILFAPRSYFCTC
jgi:hypothetical protein